MSTSTLACRSPRRPDHPAPATTTTMQRQASDSPRVKPCHRRRSHPCMAHGGGTAHQPHRHVDQKDPVPGGTTSTSQPPESVRSAGDQLRDRHKLMACKNFSRGKVRSTTNRPVGQQQRAPSPWSTRAATSWVRLCDSTEHRSPPQKTMARKYTGAHQTGRPPSRTPGSQHRHGQRIRQRPPTLHAQRGSRPGSAPWRAVRC